MIPAGSHSVYDVTGWGVYSIFCSTPGAWFHLEIATSKAVEILDWDLDGFPFPWY